MSDLWKLTSELTLKLLFCSNLTITTLLPILLLTVLYYWTTNRPVLRLMCALPSKTSVFNFKVWCGSLVFHTITTNRIYVRKYYVLSHSLLNFIIRIFLVIPFCDLYNIKRSLAICAEINGRFIARKTFAIKGFALWIFKWLFRLKFEIFNSMYCIKINKLFY